MRLPEARLLKHGRQCGLSTFEGTLETSEEPFEPERNIEIALLRCLEDVVIGVPLPADLRRHAVEALRATLRARQRQIGNGARDAAVPVLEGMNGNEPKVSDAGLQHQIHAVLAVEPVEISMHFALEAPCARGLEMNPLVAGRARDDLH